jgi:hypothetical protein
MALLVVAVAGGGATVGGAAVLAGLIAQVNGCGFSCDAAENAAPSSICKNKAKPTTEASPISRQSQIDTAWHSLPSPACCKVPALRQQSGLLKRGFAFFRVDMKRASCLRNRNGRAVICHRALNSPTIEKADPYMFLQAQYRKMLIFLALGRGGKEDPRNKYVPHHRLLFQRMIFEISRLLPDA